MKKILINNNGYVKNMYISDANTEMEVSDEDYEKVRSYPFYSAWRYLNNEFVLEHLYDDDALRDLREKQCFSTIDNRSQLWYNHLSNEQKAELEVWYQAWLDIIETRVIPEKPEWLK